MLFRSDDGTLDTTFGGGKGFVSAEFGRPVAVAADVGLQSDGAIVVVGTAFDSVNKDGAVLALARWSARGTLDADFGHELCGDCADNNADGLVDAEDPECCGQRISGDLVLRRVRIRGHGSVSAVHLDARLPEESAIDPLHEDVAIQLRQEDGPRLLCARLPATRFVARRARFVFADRSMHVPGAKGITSLAFRRIRPGLARVRGAGRAVAFPAPQAAAIRMTLGFMDPSDPARNSCATTVGSFRRQRQSIVYP